MSEDAPYRYGVELQTPNPVVDLREYVPLMKSQYGRYRFRTEYEATQFVQALTAIRPHLVLRVAPLDE